MAGMSAMEARRRILLNTPHVETAVSAGVAAFSTSLSAPLKTCRAYFGPVREGSGDPGPENVRPISGRTGLIGHVAGANLLDPDAVLDYASLSATSVISANTYKIYSAPVPRNTDMVLRKVGTAGSTVALGRKPAAIGDGIVYLAAMTNRGRYTFNTGDYDYVLLAIVRTSAPEGVQFRLEIAPEGDAYAPFAGSGAYSVSWAEEAGTVYGGYVDLATGELAAEYARIAVSTANTTVRAGETDAPGYGYPYGRYMRTVLSGGFRPFESANATCNALSKVGYDAFVNGATGYFIPSAAPNVYWLHPDCATEEGANALRSADIYFVFKLATPFRTQLSPQKVRTLKGANRVWSDAGGEMEVKYWTH